MNEIICNECQSNKHPFPIDNCLVLQAVYRRLHKKQETNYMLYMNRIKGKNYNDLP